MGSVQAQREKQPAILSSGARSPCPESQGVQAQPAQGKYAGQHRTSANRQGCRGQGTMQERELLFF